MIVTLIKENEYFDTTLPDKIKGQFWLKDKDSIGKERNLISIEAIDEQWVIKSNRNAFLTGNSNQIEKISVLQEMTVYKVTIKEPYSSALLFAEPSTRDRQIYKKYFLTSDCSITIGRGEDNIISYSDKFISGQHAVLRYVSQSWRIEDKGSTNGTFANGYRVSEKSLKCGDVIFIMGLKIVVGNGVLAINNPDNKVKIDERYLYKYPVQKIEKKEEEFDEIVNETEDFFYRSPRFKRDVQQVEIKIDSPPSPQNQEPIPLALMLGPSLTMGMVSMATAGVTINNIMTTGASLSSSLTPLLMSVSMMMSCVLWPTLTKRHEQKVRVKKEKIRQEKYLEYLQELQDTIKEKCRFQEQIMHENNVELSELIERIRNRSRTLWERSMSHNDFLTLRLGIGNLPMDADIKFPDKRFSLNEDNLQFALYALADQPKELEKVPITLSLTEDYISGIVGDRKLVLQYVKNLIVQLVTLHSYDEVKLVFIFDKDEMEEFSYAKWLPHVWNDEETVRFFITNKEEVKEISAYFENIVTEREAGSDEYPELGKYYVIIAASKELADKMDMLSKLYKMKKNIGFSVITLFDELKMLPKECSKVIELGDVEAVIYNQNDISGNKLIFKADEYDWSNIEELAYQLANIKLDLTTQRYSMPNMLTFLEMEQVGKIEHLNPMIRWKENDPTKTLQAPVGVDSSGDLFTLDLHEKFQGPHGLVAGMTGSGKSEFIITYILSMAINYHPDEVAFILIDYKGGGLTGAFEDEEKGICLPHLAGTITNLDGASVKRSLISIQSELRRRQAVFNEARKKSNEGTMDIYKYQRLRRDGVVSEAIPHLFIISDEFAELKQQQPEFMEQLISAARIGRSLGVHLILATQKPSGVVDDQIWSNSRFRVCLKVQEKADSMDMIKRPDAAALSLTGRFYLQVGFNEFFAMGQSAWCGAPYFPSEQVERKVDNSVKVIDHLGRTVKEVKPAEKRTGNSNLKQIVAIVKYLSDLAQEEHINVRPLWLDAIPAVIEVDKLIKKYKVRSETYVLNPVIGEYDDPFNQSQNIMTLPLTDEGNAILYGSVGSGKGIAIETLVYSLISQYSVDSVNLYLLDFGSEILRVFEKAPQVGEVLFSNDIEKVNNLFKMLKEEVAKRKRKFADCGGDYISYCNSTSEKVPNIVVLINNFTAFGECFENLEDDLSMLTREGLRVGIYFVLTASSTNAVRYRLQQNFKQLIVFQLNDSADYSGLLGNTDGVYPSKVKGRGIVKYDKVYEFQIAYVTEPGKEREFLRGYCDKLYRQYGKTGSRVPVLPETVDLHFIEPEIRTLAEFPVGVQKEDLEICRFDFKNSFVSFVSAQDKSSLSGFSNGLAMGLTRIENLSVELLDVDGHLKPSKSSSCKYSSDNFGSCVVNLYNDLLKRNNNYKDAGMDLKVLEQFENRIIIISGIKQLFASLNDDEKDKMKVLLAKGDALYKINFIFCESIGDTATIAYEQWFKQNVQGLYGIWIGDGITEQYILKPGKITKNLYEQVEPGFGYILKNGKLVLSKMLTADQDVLEANE